MRESILKNKMILAVDDEQDVLAVLEEEIRAACPDCTFDKATTYKEASERMVCLTYDVVLLGIVGERGLRLAELADHRDSLLVLLTAHPLDPEALRDYFKVKVHACLPIEWLGEVVPFLEEILKYHYLPGWRRLFNKKIGFQGEKIEIDWGRELALSPRGWILSDVRPKVY